jgi:ring-1,2-phenylacetyl-CoA epoxidase subunit PaaB
LGSLHPPAQRLAPPPCRLAACRGFALALQAARDVYTRRGEGNSIWVCRSSDIAASDPSFAEPNFEPADDKIYRHPTFYDIPDEVGHM